MVDGVAGQPGPLVPPPVEVAHNPEPEAVPTPVPMSVDRTVQERQAKPSPAIHIFACHRSHAANGTELLY